MNNRAAPANPTAGQPEPAAVQAMFSRIAGRYDLANRLLSGGSDVLWRKRLVREARRIRPRAALDLATGSGDVAFALAKGLGPEARVLGLDFCQPMLDEAERKKQLTGADSVTFGFGDTLDLPVADAAYDVVSISFGLRNVPDRAKALAEMRRVLRPGGLLLILEFSQPYRWVRPFYYFYLRRILPHVARRLTGDQAAYEYLCGSIEKYPDRAAISAEIEAAGFTMVRAIPMTLGVVALHVATAA
jgi:demethylmenaquinone methyltransferase / 2-methoxy-6-polyprenyl-1,4-benzoquinol methylase